MKKKLFPLISLILLILISSCSSRTKATETNYIDEMNFNGEKLEVIKVINLRAEYFNNRDKEKYASIFTPDSSQSDIDAYKDIPTIIIKLSDPKFMSESDTQITVSVHEEYKDSPYGPVGDTQYTLMKDEGVWMISGID